MTRKTMSLLAALILLQAHGLAQAGDGRRSFFRGANRAAQPTYRVANAGQTQMIYGQYYAAAPSQAAAQYRQAAYEAAPMPAEATPAAAVAPAPAAEAVAPAHHDPYGFVGMLNHYRASMGLGPLSIDGNLTAWASQNNAAQANRGLGHHVNPNCVQNCAWNYGSVASVIQGWINSPGHRANLFNPSITRVGIAYGPGPYWTMNAQ